MAKTAGAKLCKTQTQETQVWIDKKNITEPYDDSHVTYQFDRKSPPISGHARTWEGKDKDIKDTMGSPPERGSPSRNTQTINSLPLNHTAKQPNLILYPASKSF